MSERLFPARRVLWMPLDFDWQPSTSSTSHCCEEMIAALEFTCDQHSDPFDCRDTVLVYHEPFEEYGIPVRDGGQSYLVISNCPFCGARLPESGREAWFDEIDAAGHRRRRSANCRRSFRQPRGGDIRTVRDMLELVVSPASRINVRISRISVVPDAAQRRSGIHSAHNPALHVRME